MMEIGKRIKTMRRERKMKLTTLAERTGIQIATLSRIEHNKMTGTLASHLKIAKVLGVELIALYEDISNSGKPEPDSTTSQSRVETFTANQKASYEILTGNLMEKKMMPVIMRVDPNGKTHTEHHPLETERFIFILKGSITAHIDDKSFHLKTNHSLYFNASSKHWFENSGDSPAKFLSVITPVTV